jgi:hypothetical protein
MLKKLFLSMNRTSAQSLIARYSSRAERKYSLTDLDKLYSKLRPCNNKADFSIVKQLESLQLFDKSSLRIQQNIGVIIETRESLSLEKVLLNFVECTGLNVQLYCGLRNKDFVFKSRIADLVQSGKVMLNVLPVTSLTHAQYNAILLSETFWLSLMTHEKVIVFQTDSWICSGSPYRLSDFFHFDYIGSTWARKRPIGLTIDGGSGGLSLRDWRRSLEALREFEPKKWSGGEDGFFAFHIELLGGRVATMPEAGKFSTQNTFRDKSFGAHQISLLI